MKKGKNKRNKKIYAYRKHFFGETPIDYKNFGLSSKS